MNLHCVIHYPHLKIGNEEITALKESTYLTLINGRAARQALGGSYLHQDQCDSIPEILDTAKHGYHRQCYQKFTNAISVEKRKKSCEATLQTETKRPRQSGEFSGGLFLKICMICKSDGTKKVKNERQKIKVIQTISACEKMILAAELHNDEEMRLAVSGEDLIAKEFRYHEKCYKDYTRICSKSTQKVINEDDVSTSVNFGDFDALKEFVQEHVINGDQSVSMKLLTDVYGLNKDDTRVRSKVKKKLENEFGDQILFVSVAYHEAQVVISRKAISETSLSSFVRENKDFILKEAAKILRGDIIDMIATAPSLRWPPTVEDLTVDERQPPQSLIEFLSLMLHSTHHSTGEVVQRYSQSIAQDLVHAVSKRQFMTAKHTLLGTALHSLTGQRLPIDILARLGHSCNYDTVQRIETAQAELVQTMASRNYPLPLIPASENSSVLTFFWWDNFDCKKETMEGSIHTCHGIAFQEQSADSIIRDDLQLSILDSGCKTVKVQEQELRKVSIQPHKEPVLLASPPHERQKYEDKSARMLFLWKLLRTAHSFGDQKISRFVGWIISIYGTAHGTPTLLTFLPPILHPITDYSTVAECIFQSQQLSKAANIT